jgi:hypothetical protein
LGFIANDFGSDPEFLGPGSSVLGGSDVIAATAAAVTGNATPSFVSIFFSPSCRP